MGKETKAPIITRKNNDNNNTNNNKKKHNDNNNNTSFGVCVQVNSTSVYIPGVVYLLVMGRQVQDSHRVSEKE